MNIEPPFVPPHIAYPLGLWTLRQVCAANINGIDIYDDVVQVTGTRNDTDEVAAEFAPPHNVSTFEIADYFGVPVERVTDQRGITQ